VLQQNYEYLQADAKSASISLVEREIDYIRNDLGTVATISTFIASFLYGNIAGFDNYKDSNADVEYVEIVCMFLTLLR
jgi:hypothetical protein